MDQSAIKALARRVGIHKPCDLIEFTDNLEWIAGQCEPSTDPMPTITEKKRWLASIAKTADKLAGLLEDHPLGIDTRDITGERDMAEYIMDKKLHSWGDDLGRPRWENPLADLKDTAANARGLIDKMTVQDHPDGRYAEMNNCIIDDKTYRKYRAIDLIGWLWRKRTGKVPNRSTEYQDFLADAATVIGIPDPEKLSDAFRNRIAKFQKLQE